MASQFAMSKYKIRTRFVSRNTFAFHMKTIFAHDFFVIVVYFISFLILAEREREKERRTKNIVNAVFSGFRLFIICLAFKGKIIFVKPIWISIFSNVSK